MFLRFYGTWLVVSARVADAVERRMEAKREAGFSTAEGIASAALGALALLVIWAAVRDFGKNIMTWLTTTVKTLP